MYVPPFGRQAPTTDTRLAVEVSGPGAINPHKRVRIWSLIGALVQTRARIGIGRWVRFYNERRPHRALGYNSPAATWAAEAGSVDRGLDDAGASPATPQAQEQQNVIHI